MDVLDKIPLELDTDELLRKLHVAKGSLDAKEVQRLARSAVAVGRPKAIYEVSYIEERDYNTIKIDGVTFTSHVLRVNLDEVERVFPYIATCGGELDKLVSPADDFMLGFWLDTIKDMALVASRGYLSSYLERKYALGQMSRMSPGSGVEDLWPIQQQRELFSIFGNTEDLIGVTLTDSFLMVPNKSVSGILFPTEIRFETCQLCPRTGCSGRRAPYDASAVESYYREKD